MRKLLAVARLNLIELLQEKDVYISGLVMPIILTFLVSLAFGGMGQTEVYAERIGVLDLSRPHVAGSPSQGLSETGGAMGSLTEDLLGALKSIPGIEVETFNSSLDMNRALLDGKVSFGVIIPEKFEESLKKSEKINVDIVKYKEGPPTAGELAVLNLLNRLEVAASSAGEALSIYASLPAGKGAGQNLTQDSRQSGTAGKDAAQAGDVTKAGDVIKEQIWSSVESKVFAQLATPPVRTIVEESQSKGSQEDILPMNYYSSIGFMLMFLSMVTVSGLASSLIKEKEQGTLTRLLTCPVSFWSILGGKGTATYVIGLVQSALLIGFGMILGVPWSRNALGVVLMVIGFLFAMVGMGIFIGSMAKTRTQAGVVSSLVTVVGSMIGGSWWPLEIVPGPLRTLAYLTPYGWGVTGLTNVIGRGYSLGQVAPSSALLFAFGLFLAALGITRIRKV